MRKRISVALVIFILVSLIVILVTYFTKFSFFRGSIQELFNNPKASLYQFKTKNTDSAEEKKLKDENQKLISKLVDFEKLKADNDALRSQFQDSPIPSSQLLPVHVIGSLGNDTLLVDQGSHAGIKVGQNVIVGKNFVGLISTVSENSARVMLSTNPAFTTLGKTLQDNALGVIHGQADFILLDNVIITDKLTSGDLVITRGEIKNKDNKVLTNLIVGKIRSINKAETKPFQTAQVEPLANYSRANLLFIVVKDS